MDTGTIQAHSERSLIGCILVDSEARDYCLSRVKPEHFIDPGCRGIYETILSLVDKRESVNIASVSLHGHDMVALCEMTSDVIPAGYQTYVTAVMTAAVKRRALSAANNLVSKLSDKFMTIEDISAELNAMSDVIPRDTRQQEVSLYDAMLQLPDELEREAKDGNLKFGWRDIDGLTGGLWPSELSIIAAAPGAGKTAFALNIAENVAKQGGKVLFESLEMSVLQLSKRLCAMQGIDGGKMRRPGTLEEKDWLQIPDIAVRLGKLPITFDRTGYIQQLHNKCSRLRERGNLDLLIIDYLTLMRSITRSESRRHEVEYISRTLKLMSLEMNIPVIVLSQLTREGQRPTGPTVNDLRETGAIEQDGDNILFLFDPKAKDNLSAQWVDINVILAKQRNGSTGKITMRFDKRYMKFGCLEK